ncbi:MAG: dihydrofolate reductase family protein [Acidobacteriota bacterium]
MRNLTYLVACSADGFIARENGAIDEFTFEGEHVADLLREFPETLPTHFRGALGIEGDNRRFDTVLMGRRTYEVGLSEGITSPYQHLEQFLFSTSLPASPDPTVELISEGAIEAVRELKARGGLDIWLCGGSELAAALFPEIDQLIVKSNPFLMGRGKTLFAREMPKAELRLIEQRRYDSGFALLHYEISR